MQSNNVLLKHFFVLSMFKKSPKDRLKVMIDLAYILLYEVQKTHPLFFPESEKAKADRSYNNWRVLLRTSVSSKRLHVVLKFDGKSLNSNSLGITYGSLFESVVSNFSRLDKVVISCRNGS